MAWLVNKPLHWHARLCAQLRLLSRCKHSRMLLGKAGSRPPFESGHQCSTRPWSCMQSGRGRVCVSVGGCGRATCTSKCVHRPPPPPPCCHSVLKSSSCNARGVDESGDARRGLSSLDDIGGPIHVDLAHQVRGGRRQVHDRSSVKHSLTTCTKLVRARVCMCVHVCVKERQRRVLCYVPLPLSISPSLAPFSLSFSLVSFCLCLVCFPPSPLSFLPPSPTAHLGKR